MHTDASAHVLGAALYQEQENKLRVTACASRGLSKSEQRYPAHKLDFLSVKWAVTQNVFRYLYGAKFTVMTDNNPLTYVLTSAKLDAVGHCWLAVLSSFDFDIEYSAGKDNQDADGLLRRPYLHACDISDQSSNDEENAIEGFTAQLLRRNKEPDFPTEAVKAVCKRHEYSSTLEEEAAVPSSARVQCLAIGASAIPADFCQTDVAGPCPLKQMSLSDWLLEQKLDLES